MKRCISYFSCMLYIFLASVMYAQPPGKEQDQQSEIELNARNMRLAYNARTVSWWDSGNGFIYKYSISNANYLTRYDRQGNYVETLIQKEWNDNVSLTLQSSFQQSQYKSQKIASYWEVMDPQKKGYYLELNATDNRLISVWADEHGNFSTVPGNRPKQ